MDKSLKLMIFTIDGQCYGLSLNSVATVLRAVAVTQIPKASHFILGVINVHGEIVPVLDIRSLFGLNKKEITLADHFIVAQIFSQTVVVAVDAVINLTEYITEEKAVAAEVCSYHVNAVLNNDSKMIITLDLEKMLSHNDVEELKALTLEGRKIV